MTIRWRRALVGMGLLWMVMFFAAIGLAETKPAVITLDQAVKMALEYDSQVLISRNDLEKAKLVVKQEALKILPQASIEDSYGFTLNDDKGPQNFTMIVNQTIPTGGNLFGEKVVSNMEAAVWDRIYNEAGLQIAISNVIYNTRVYYFNALKAQKSIPLLENGVKNAQATCDLANLQLSQGKTTKPAQLKTEMDLATAVYNLEKGRSDYRLALQQLANQIGWDGDTNLLQLEDVPLDSLPATLNYKTCKSQALQNRLELQQTLITIRKAERVISQDRNQELPKVSLGYNNISQTESFSMNYDFKSGDLSWKGAYQKNQNYQSASQDSGTASGAKMFGQNQKYFLLRFSWTLDFGATRNTTEQARLTLNSAKRQQEQQQREIALAIDQDGADYDLAIKKITSYAMAIPYYQKTLEIKKLEHQLGSATALDTATARQDLISAQIQLLQAQYDQMIAYQKLRQAMGEFYQFAKK